MKSLTSCTILIVCLISIQSLHGQELLKLKPFKRAHPQAKKLVYGEEGWWAFSEDDLWGIYEETSKRVIIPPAYDLVVPSLRQGLFYITHDSLVGLYDTQSGTELIPPGENSITNLSIVTDQDNELYATGHWQEISKNGTYTSYKTHFINYRLVHKPEGWKAIASEDKYITDRNVDRLFDQLEWATGECWNHSFASLRTHEVPAAGGKPVKQVLDGKSEHSSILSATGFHYLVPPEYLTIHPSEDYLVAGLADSIGNEFDPFGVAPMRGLYDTEYQLVINPIKGVVGSIEPTGFYGRDEVKGLLIYDEKGHLLSITPDFHHFIEQITQWGDKYYIEVLSFTPESMEMRINNSMVIASDGTLIKAWPFEIQVPYDDMAITSIVGLNPGEYTPLYGLYDMAKDLVITDSLYGDYHKWDKDETLINVIDHCNYYYEFTSYEKNVFFDCQGKQITGEGMAILNGKRLILTPFDKDLYFDLSTLEVPFSPSYTSTINEVDDYFMWEGPELLMIEEERLEDLIIYKVYNRITREITYGLVHQNDDHFTLAPEMYEMSFDRTGKQVQFVYQHQKYEFPISRYKK